MIYAYNLNAGPGVLPLEVLQEAQQRIKELLALSSDYNVLFLPGGASAQFSMVPINFLVEGKTTGYVNSLRRLEVDNDDVSFDLMSIFARWSTIRLSEVLVDETKRPIYF